MKSMLRIHHGGGWFFFGSLKSASPASVFLVAERITNIKIMVTENPNNGETKRESPVSSTLAQFNASPLASVRKEKANPTPKIDPMRVWELEQGIPKYHVSKFQKMAVTSNASTMAILWDIF